MPRPPVIGTIAKGACADDGAVEAEVAGGMPRPLEAAGADGDENSEEGRYIGYFTGATSRPPEDCTNEADEGEHGVAQVEIAHITITDGSPPLQKS